MEEYNCKQTTPFLDYVKNVIDTEFQMEFKSQMSEGKGLMISATESDINATYVNGGFKEIASMLSQSFSTLSKSMAHNDNASDLEMKFVCQFLNDLDEDWFDKFELFFSFVYDQQRKKKKKNKSQKYETVPTEAAAPSTTIEEPRKSDFHNYIKNVVDTEFQCELKADMGEGKALIIGAIDQGDVSTYANGGINETCSIIAHFFNSFARRFNEKYSSPQDAKLHFIHDILDKVNDDWFQIFMNLHNSYILDLEYEKEKKKIAKQAMKALKKAKKKKKKD